MRSLILLTTTSLFLAALALAGQGCVTVPAGPGGGIVAIPTVSEPKSYVVREGPAGNARPSKMDLGDPCSVRMQDMVGPIYEYYALHRRLPDNLEELRTVSDIEVDLNFTCPKSGKPYIYNPAGLAPPTGGGLRLVLYDATPAHNNHRWAVMAGMGRNKENQSFPEAFVVNLSEQDFQTYKPLPPPTSQPDTITPVDPPARLSPAQGQP